MKEVSLKLGEYEFTSNEVRELYKCPNCGVKIEWEVK